MSNLIDPQTGEYVGGDKNAFENMRARLSELAYEKANLEARIAEDLNNWRARIRLTEVKNDIASIKGALSL